MSYSLKEQEGNTNGRITGQMTFKAQGVQVLAESLLARGICKCFPDNGMVKGETDLAQTLISPFFSYHLSVTTDMSKSALTAKVTHPHRGPF